MANFLEFPFQKSGSVRWWEGSLGFGDHSGMYLRAGNTLFQLMASYEQGVMFLLCGCYCSGGAACQIDPNGGVTRLQSHCGQHVHYRKARIATSSHRLPICIKALRTRRSKEAGSASAPKSDVSLQSGRELSRPLRSPCEQKLDGKGSGESEQD